MNEPITTEAQQLQQDEKQVGECLVCAKPIYQFILCMECRFVTSACENCYSQPATHRTSEHYLACRHTPLTARQHQQQPDFIRPHEYQQWHSQCSCRNCGELTESDRRDDSAIFCRHGEIPYCKKECRDADRERREKEDECCSDKVHLPPQATAPSVLSSPLIPDLLAHAISFLSLFQWSRAARVNHAWRNVTLLPSAFTHEAVIPKSLDFVPAVYRACIRRLHQYEIRDADDPKEHLSEYTHLTSYTTNDRQLDRNDRHLTRINLVTNAELTLLTEFPHLKSVWINVLCGYERAARSLTVLTQLAKLEELNFNLVWSQDIDPQLLERDRQVYADVLSFIAHDGLPLLRTLKLSDNSVTLPISMGSTSDLSISFPRITDLNLEEHFTADLSQHRLFFLEHLGQYFPALKSLKLVIRFPHAVVFDPKYLSVQKQYLDLVATCLASVSSTLESLSLTFDKYYEGDQGVGEWPADYRLLFDRIDDILSSSCFQLRHLVICNFSNMVRQRIPREVEILARRTPKIEELAIQLEAKEDEEEARTIVSSMVEGITQRFQSLVSLRIDGWKKMKSIVLRSPSSEFISVCDSLPHLRQLTLFEIDIETQLPSLLRLLPRLDAIHLEKVKLAAHRFFEYAQYRPLLLTSQHDHSDYDDQIGSIPAIQMIEEDQLDWLRVESSIHEESLPAVLPGYLHSAYECGVALAALPPIDASSHGWMFSRVSRWTWAYIDIVATTVEVATPKLVQTCLTAEETALSTENVAPPSHAQATPSATVDLSDTFAFYRSSQWSFHDASSSVNSSSLSSSSSSACGVVPLVSLPAMISVRSRIRQLAAEMNPEPAAVWWSVW